MLERIGTIGAVLTMAVLVTSVTLATPVQAADNAGTEARAEQRRVVYHINDSEDQALGALRSMRNHLDVAPDTTIVVVAHGDGIDFLLDGHEDGDTLQPLIGGLAARGVVFEVCEITMDRRGLSHDDFVLEAEFTPSGVARLVELQAGQSFAYIKP